MVPDRKRAVCEALISQCLPAIQCTAQSMQVSVASGLRFASWRVGNVAVAAG
jgi:hypothetical protein